MSEKARSVVDCRDFPGLMTGPDPTDLPPGASQHQVNLMSIHIGETRTRPAAERVEFEED